MKYKLTSAKTFYGPHRVPFTVREDGPIPQEIESAEDLDLEAIAHELNYVVHNRGNTSAWKLHINTTTPEKAAELNKMLHDGGASESFRPVIYIAGEGIGINYTAAGGEFTEE